MKKGIIFLKNKWNIQFIGIFSLCVLIWFLGPLIAVNGKTFLISELSRWIVILVILILWLLNILRLYIKANKINARLNEELSADEAECENDQSIEDEVEGLRDNFENALQVLKKIKQKAIGGKFSLYELPWYIIIGPPGSGKTTALVHSGLEFPLADHFGKNAIRGVGGTRNCDWWFTEQAVLLDTAGRYTTQDSHKDKDQAAWMDFLRLLKKYRPRRPINGVLVAMSLSDLLKFSESERKAHAKAIKQRLQELNEQLGIRVPVYVLFTKVDLIAGCTDYFADLSVEERSQVWGMTFKEEMLKQNEWLEHFAENFQRLLERLYKGLNKRMQDERNLERRQLIFAFPQRMALLQAPITLFLKECFSENRYQESALLRGVYFTSGTQEGTPIDKLMAILSSHFKLQRVKPVIFSGKGKSFFLYRLFSDVIFAESELVGLDWRVEKRRIFWRRIFLGAAIALILLMTGLWTQSYLKNNQRIQEFSRKIDEYQSLSVSDINSETTDFLPLLKKMEALRSIRETFPEDVPLTMRLGLYQGDKLTHIAQSVYIKYLREQFLPRIKNRLEQRLSGTESNNPEVLYQLLRVYLMLSEPKRADKSIIRPWVKIDWEDNYPQTTVQRLLLHLDELLKSPFPAQRIDQKLVQNIRQSLTQIPLSQQIYMQIKEEALKKHEDDFSLKEALGVGGEQVFSVVSGHFDEIYIPGFFTYKGFHKTFLNESNNLAKQTIKQAWVLGNKDTVGVKNSQQLENKLVKHYYNEFIERWDNLLANLHVRKAENIQQAIEILDTVSSTDSPLIKLLHAIDQETSLTREFIANPLKSEKKASISKDDRMRQLLGAATVAGLDDSGVDRSGKPVEQHFSELVQLIRNSGAGTAITPIITDLNHLYNYMADLNNTSNTGEAAMNLALQARGNGGDNIVSKLHLETMRLPEPVKRWVRSLVSDNWSLVLGGVKGQLNKALKSKLEPLCKAGLEGRYPLVKDSEQDVTLQDFGRFFSPHGLLDQFFDTYLKQFVDTSGKRWKIIKQNNQSVGISASTLEQFQRADKIKKIFFQSGGSAPQIRFQIRPVFLDANASRFWLNLEGQQISYRHGPIRAVTFQWPGSQPGLVRYGFETPEGRQFADSVEGPWAWFRLLDKVQIKQTASNKFELYFTLQGLKARYEILADSVLNPFDSSELTGFKCPTRI